MGSLHLLLLLLLLVSSQIKTKLFASFDLFESQMREKCSLTRERPTVRLKDYDCGASGRRYSSLITIAAIDRNGTQSFRLN